MFQIQTDLFNNTVCLKLLPSWLFFLWYFRTSLITILEVLNGTTYFALHYWNSLKLMKERPFYRSSDRRCCVRKGVLRNFTKSCGVGRTYLFLHFTMLNVRTVMYFWQYFCIYVSLLTKIQTCFSFRFSFF